MKRSISRRQFLSLVATGALAAACGQAQPSAAPTSVPANTPPPADTPTSAPTAAPAAPGRPDVIKFYPAVPSKVVQTHHTGVWQGDQLSPEALRQMLDASITKLTGLDEAKLAWAALFKPTEKIAIKVNAFVDSAIWTHVLLVKAVLASLQEIGVPARQIFIYDYLCVFKDAGFEINEDGPGVRCIRETKFSGQFKVADTTADLSDTLQSCDALINMPVLKAHMLSGLTFAMKNHFGTVNNPRGLHSPIDQCLAELNALPPIKDKTRLIIGDVLEANLKPSNGWPYWKADWKGDSILMSFDPVAHDTLGMQILERLQTEKKSALAKPLKALATSYLQKAAELGLGTNNPKNIDIVEVKLS